MPVTDLALEEDPVGQLFGKDTVEAPANTQTPSAAHPRNSLPARGRERAISAEIPPRRAPLPPVAAPKAAGEPVSKSTMLGHAAPPAAAFGAPDAPPRAAPAKRVNTPAGVLTGALAPKAGSAESGTILRASIGPAASARPSSQQLAPGAGDVAPTQGTRTLEFEGSTEPSGLELAAPTPAQERAQSLRPKRPATSSAPAPTRRSPAPAAAQTQLTSDAEDHPAPAAAAAQDVRSDRPSRRPRHDKRTEARRAARRAAAKHLPAPPTASARRWDPARVTIAAFSAVVAAGAIGVGAVWLGWISLPPSASAMLALERRGSSRASAVPAKSPNLVMPSAPEPAPEPAAKPAPEPLAAPAETTPAAELPAPADPPAEPAAIAQPAAAPAEPEPQLAVEADPQPVAAAVEASPAPQPSAAAAPAEVSADPAKLVAIARAKLASDPPGAAELMMRAIAKDPADHHAMEVLVRAWIAMERGRDAVGYAEYMVKKRPKRAIYRLLEGDAKRQAGDHAGAAAAYRALLELEPNNRDAKRRLGLE